MRCAGTGAGPPSGPLVPGTESDDCRVVATGADINAFNSNSEQTNDAVSWKMAVWESSCCCSALRCKRSAPPRCELSTVRTTAALA